MYFAFKKKLIHYQSLFEAEKADWSKARDTG